MNNRFLLLASALLLCSNSFFAQSNLSNAKVPSEIGLKSEAQMNADNDKPLPYGYVDDRDNLFGKRVWEIIDLDERVNFPFYFPIEENIGNDRKSLFNVLVSGMKDGSISEVYDDSYFTTKKSLEEILSAFYRKELSDYGIDVLNRYPKKSEAQLVAEGKLTDEHYTTSQVTAEDIAQYRIVGQWYFDSRQSELKYRILGICPMAVDALSKMRGIENAEPLELFWVFVPAARDILHENKAFNNKNSAMPFSFDHLLNARRFSAVIYKEENVYGNRSVSDYVRENAQLQLLESERIKEKIRDFEQDMWNY
ncbi:MAG: gliding motility protein GldN [Flavobacterium sp.]|nr:gliding motility protein GldN [Candidatus Neoflavobacterium equi]